MHEIQNCYGAISSGRPPIIGGSSNTRGLHLRKRIYRDRQRILTLSIQPTVETHQASSYSTSYLNTPLQLHKDRIKEPSIHRNKIDNQLRDGLRFSKPYARERER